MDISDVMIHIDMPLGEEERASLEEYLRELPGVVAPRFAPMASHLLVVAFDPRQIKARGLLARVKARGYGAQLVGA